MISISEEQVAALRQEAAKRFESEMVAHAVQFSPELCEALKPDQVRLAVARSIERAHTHGFNMRGSQRLFLELVLFFGSDFDTDPQYARLQGLLTKDIDQMTRAVELHAHVVEYQNVVAGEGGTNANASLRALAKIARSDRYVPRDDPAFLLDELKKAYPEKSSYTGESGLLSLIELSGDLSEKHGLDGPRARVMVVAMMFAFGAGMASDPFYPWIGRTLNDEKITDNERRANRLEKKALIWLDSVLDHTGGGGPS